MDISSKQPLTTPKVEEYETLDQDEVQKEGFHYTGSRREQRRFPPRINFEAKPATRVGWVDKDKKKVTFYSCYAEGHNSPQCVLKLQQIHEVITNYEELSDKDRADVPDDAYKNGKAYLDFKKKTKEEAEEEGNDTP